MKVLAILLDTEWVQVGTLDGGPDDDMIRALGVCGACGASGEYQRHERVPNGLVVCGSCRAWFAIYEIDETMLREGV